MTGAMQAAAALACLLGLAACGGGGGGSAGGGSAGGGPTVPPPEPIFLERTAAAVTTMNAAIDALTPTMGEVPDRMGNSRLDAGDGIGYFITAPGSAATPMIGYAPVIDSTAQVPLTPVHMRGNAWRFEDSYLSGDTDYEAVILLSYDTTLTGSNSHYWGIWLRKSARDDGTTHWDDFDPFNHSEHRAFGSAGLAAAEGSFSYTGEALGVYTKDGTSAGYFTARAGLTVNYGGTGVLDADKWTLTGTIDSFVLSGNEENSWSVDLSATPNSTDSTTGVPANPSGNLWDGTANGSGKAGVVSTNYFGPNTAPPTIIQGKFKAFFTDGAVAGAFNGRR